MIPHNRPSIERRDIEAVSLTLRSAMIGEGGLTRRFERALAQRYGFQYAVAVGSGCQALLLALRATGLVLGKRLATSTYVCPEVMSVIEANGAQCLLADIGNNFLMDPEDIALAGVDGVVVPAIMGIPADPAAFPNTVVKIVDWAQYAPAPGSNESAGWDAAIVSFEATKLLTSGEGGAVLTSNPDIAARLISQKRIGESVLRLNLFPMSDFQAALVMSQLQRLDHMLTRRAEIANRYKSASGHATVACPERPTRYVIEVSDPVKVTGAFAEVGISARRPVEPMCHTVRPESRSFPGAHRAWERLVSLPCHPSMSEEEIQFVAQSVGALL